MVEIESDDRPFLIVTGSSAGGIDALLAFAAGLPEDFPAPIVAAQHLDPNHVSHLQQILALRSTLPVKVVREREALQPGTFYVVPPDCDVLIVDGDVATFESPHGPKPSVDRLFKSAAERYGERLVAVIFSGMGNDGLAGARVVKERGGTVVIQDPVTASHPSMPLAIPPTLVDLVARPEAMGKTLAELLRGTRVPTGANEQNVLRALLTQLRDRSCIDFLQYKTPTIMRRLSRLMVASGVDSVAEYLRYLQSHPEGYQRLISAFLIKVTDFFRDEALFDELKNVLLPRLVAEARQRGSELRIWSAGTSTGEEAYSLAILCAELIVEGDPVGVRIFATDVDDEAVAFARRGIYTREALHHVPPSWVERYFVRSDDSFKVGKRIRNMTVFGQHDLGQRAAFPHVDLCMCRNVLIYFTRELQTRALALFAFSLREDGCLILGKAESASPLSEYFQPVNQALKIYARQGKRVPLPLAKSRDTAVTAPEVRAAGKNTAQLLPMTIVQRGTESRPTINETLGAFAAKSFIGIVVVDHHYDIVTLNAAARTLLDIHGVALGDDLIHLVRTVDGNALRELIDAAFLAEPSDPREMLAGAGDGAERWLEVACYPERGTTSSRADLVAVFAIDVTQAVLRRRELERLTAEREEHIRAIEARIGQLTMREKALLQANDELTFVNGELRNDNETFQLKVEESASAGEEVEMLNEEMQATNEELETLNEELQATVEELNTTNDELESRVSEAERLGEASEAHLSRIESSRQTLKSALDSLPLSVAVLDAGGALVHASPAIAAWAAAAGDRWWERAARIDVEGRAYSVSTQPLDPADKHDTLVILREAT